MTRAIVALPLIMLVAGCSWWDGWWKRDALPPPPPRALAASAALVGAARDTIEVTVRDLSPATRIDAILLLAPDGRALESLDIRRKTSESGGGGFTRPIIGIGVSGGSASGINPSLSLDWQYHRDGPDQKNRQAVAQLRLEDPALYHATAEAWRIEIRYTDVTGEQRSLVMPSPLAN